MLYIYISTVHNNIDYDIVLICYRQTPFLHIIIWTLWIARPICCCFHSCPSKKNLCIFLVFPEVHRFGHRATGFGVKSTWCSLGTFQQMPTPQQEVWPVPSMPWEFQNGHEWLGWRNASVRHVGFAEVVWSYWGFQKFKGLMAWELLVGFENLINLVLGGNLHLRTVINLYFFI